MRTIYSKSGMGELSITEANTYASFYGICCCFTVKVYSTVGFVGIRFEFAPAPSEAPKTEGCAFGNWMRIAEGHGTNRRVVEQEVYLRPFMIEVVPFMAMRDGTEVHAREICQATFRTYANIVEFIRQEVFACFAQDFRLRAATSLDKQYGESTRNTVENLIGSLHWELLLSDVNPPQIVKDVILFTFANNTPQYYNLASDGNPNVDGYIGFVDEHNRMNQIYATIEDDKKEAIKREADVKAAQLLRMVLGDDHFAEFVSLGHVNIEERGWKFQLHPGAFVYAEDPEGHKGRLCIHTASLSCNRIDEIVLAYLHIRHKFDEYMATAIAHESGPGFSLAQFKKKKK
jgi:hypothetical protein